MFIAYMYRILKYLLRWPFLLPSLFILLNLWLFFRTNYKSVIIDAWPPWKSRNISEYIRPEEITAHILPTQHCDGDELALMLVLSAPKNIDLRNTIRDTWGNWINTKSVNELRELFQPTVFHSNHSNIDSVTQFLNITPRHKFKLLFLMGKSSEDISVSSEMLLEHAAFGDIIVEDFIESYHNLTLKTTFALKYYNNFCSSAKFYIKVDDDVFVHVPNLQKLLVNSPKSNNYIMGQKMQGYTPDKNPFLKWYVPNYIYDSNTKYPLHVTGAMYIVCGNLVANLINASASVPFTLLEDVYVTGLLAEKIYAYLIGVENFRIQVHKPHPIDHCDLEKYIVGYEVDSIEMERIWTSLFSESVRKTCNHKDSL